MTQPGSLPNIVPPTSKFDALLRRVQNLERDLAALRTARSGEAMAIGKGGIRIKAPGALKIVDATTGDVLAELQEDGLYVYQGGQVDINDGGHIDLNDGSYLAVNDGGAFRLETPANIVVVSMQRSDIPDGSGRTQQTFAVGREDGTLALSLADYGTVFGHPHHQNIAMWDRNGGVLFTDDTDSGQGLAWPLIALGVWASNSYPTDTTTSSSFQTVNTLSGYKQHPRVVVGVLARCDDPATTGEVRVTDQDGNVIGGVATLSAGAYVQFTIGPAALAGTHGQSIGLNLQVRRTAGTGTVGARGLMAVGLGS